MLRNNISHPYCFILKTESWMWKRRRLYPQGWTSAYAERAKQFPAYSFGVGCSIAFEKRRLRHY